MKAERMVVKTAAAKVDLLRRRRVIKCYNNYKNEIYAVILQIISGGFSIPVILFLFLLSSYSQIHIYITHKY